MGAFIKWLVGQDIVFINDMSFETIAQYKISPDRSLLCGVNENGGYNCGCVSLFSKKIFVKLEREPGDVTEFDPCQVRILKNGNFMLLEVLADPVTLPTPPPVEHTETNTVRVITEAIESGVALACSDAAVKGTAMAFSAILTNTSNDFEHEICASTNIWHDKKSDAAEGRGLLAIFEFLRKNLHEDTRGAIEIYSDSQNAIKWSLQRITYSKAAKPNGEIWAPIQDTIQFFKKIKFTLSYVKSHPKKDILFHQNAANYLIFECNKRAVKLRSDTEEATCTITLPEIENGCVFYQDVRETRSINTLIKEHDADSSLMSYVQHRFPETYQLIDIRARYAFPKGVERHVVKFSIGFNHHGCRENLFHQKLSSACDICGVEEGWAHILTCPYMRSRNKEFLLKLHNKLRKINECQDDVDLFIQNIGLFLNGHSNMTGTQAAIGYKNIFRGFIVRDWFGSNESQQKFGELNRVIVHDAVTHYAANWRVRNLRRNSQECQKERLLEWAKGENASVENFKTPVLARYMQNYDRIMTMTPDKIKKWLIALHSLRKKSRNSVTNDIRAFCIPTS